MRTIRTDNRLQDAPMQPVLCERCGASLLVRKSSWDQTSVQWDETALSRCEERAAVHHSASGRVFEMCGALRSSIRRAAVEGSIQVQADDAR